MRPLNLTHVVGVRDETEATLTTDRLSRTFNLTLIRERDGVSSFLMLLLVRASII